MSSWRDSRQLYDAWNHALPDKVRVGRGITAGFRTVLANLCFQQARPDSCTPCSNDPKARQLRKEYVFKLVPMINPDGVVSGNSRSTLEGADLNRMWLEASPENRRRCGRGEGWGIVDGKEEGVGKREALVSQTHKAITN